MVVTALESELSVQQQPFLITPKTFGVLEAERGYNDRGFCCVMRNFRSLLKRNN